MISMCQNLISSTVFYLLFEILNAILQYLMLFFIVIAFTVAKTDSILLSINFIIDLYKCSGYNIIVNYYFFMFLCMKQV